VWSDAALAALPELLAGHRRVADFFAGTGKIHDYLASYGFDTVGLELEAEWAACHPRTICGDVFDPAAVDAVGDFDAIATSPTFGNRFADHHKAYDPEARYGYTHDLGRALSPNNSGVMQWKGYDKGEYCDFHARALAILVERLPTGGAFALNMKDHRRKWKRAPVTLWYVDVLVYRLGLEVVKWVTVDTPGLRVGANRDDRYPECVILFGKP
jgi:hypothetical protein